MKTQADKLEEIVSKETHPCKIVAVTSGKGGVGKSTFSANIANILSKEGYKVALFDADIGLANLDILFNVKAPKNLLDFLKKECSFQDIVIPIKENLSLIPGESGSEILEFDNQMIFDEVMKEQTFLESLDYLIIDTSAGIGESVQPFLAQADEVIVITMPDPSAITDAYAAIKVTSMTNPHISLIINYVEDRKEGALIFDKIKNVAEENLSSDLKLSHLGSISQDKIILNSAKYRFLFTEKYPNSLPTFELNEIIQNLVYKLEQKVLLPKTRKSFTVFVRRLIEKF